MRKWIKFLEINFDKSRIYGLDILRAVSIFFVVMPHGNALLPANNPLTYFGFDGVAIFFVLSGFLIGKILISILEQEKATPKTLLNFYVRRWFRTLPNYFLVFSTLVLLSLFLGNLNIDFKTEHVYLYIFFSQNLFTPHPNFFPEAWSLPVEEWFYLLIPAILFSFVGIFRIPAKKTVLITSVTILLFTVLFRYLRYTNITVDTIYEWDIMYRKQVATRLDSLMFGVLGAYAAYYYKPQWVKHKYSLFFLGIVIIFAVKIIGLLELHGYGIYFCVFSFSITATGILFLLPFLSEYKSGSGFIYKAITYTSIISYSMYLINLSLVQQWMLKPLQILNLGEIQYTVLRYLLYWLFTVIGSILLYKYFEKPFTDLREI